MGKGDQVREHQARVTRNFGWHSINAVPRMAGVRLRGRLDRMTRLFCCSERSGTSLHSRPCNFLAAIGPTTTHLSLDKDAPLGRAVQRDGTIVAVPILSGLHHGYARI